MTKRKPATTNKIEIVYNNNTSYVIPRVTNFSVASDGKSIKGKYTKTTKIHSITQQHEIDFTIDLIDTVSFKYIATLGVISSSYKVSNGRISEKTEYLTEDDYYNMKVDSYIVTNLHSDLHIGDGWTIM